MTRCINGILKLVVLYCAACGIADAHPGHFSISEIEWNEQSRRFEVAMRLRIPDLEDAVSASLGRRFSIESSANAESVVQRYLQQHFFVVFEGHSRTRLHWVGMEPELHDIWVYFEAESLPAAPEAPGQKDAAETTTTNPTTVADNWQALLASGGTGTAASTAVRIRNSVLMDVQPEQNNVLVLKAGDHRQTCVLSAKQRVATLSLAPADRTTTPRH